MAENPPADPAVTCDDANRPGLTGSQRLRRLLARQFGDKFGWTLSRTEFSASCLARRGHHDGYRLRGYDLGPVPLPLFDHPYFYRDHRRRAAGIAVHRYNWSENEPKCRDFAGAHQLLVREVIDFPSWWWLGETTLVLWTPQSPIGGVE